MTNFSPDQQKETWSPEADINYLLTGYPVRTENTKPWVT